VPQQHAASDEPGQGEAALEQERYVVHLPIFEGPLDLLLHLIEKHQMEITTVSLVAVTDQYLAHLKHWQNEQLPLANMAAFVMIAARLLHIKSQSLLPQPPREDANVVEDSATVLAEELQHHLREYKLVKGIAQVLRQREEAGLQTHSRSSLLAGIEAQLAWTPPTLVKTETQALARTFQRLLELQTRDEKNGNELMPVARVRVSERIAEIMSRLEEREAVMLAEIIEHEHSRLVIIVTFLAVLELWKWERVNVRQEGLMAPIVLERGARWSVEGQEELQAEEFL
jgi:segregation and condensation protein A